MSLCQTGHTKQRLTSDDDPLVTLHTDDGHCNHDPDRLAMAELEKRVEPGHPYHVKLNQDEYRVGLSQEKLPPLPVWT